MLRSPRLPFPVPVRALLTISMAALVLAGASPAAAQGSCEVEWTDTLLDIPRDNTCIASPIRDRAFGVETFMRSGNEYLMMSRGNELQIFRLGADPARPASVDTSNFRFGTAGDSDYDVMTFDVCDDCRFGVMDHKVAGVVVFDLGVLSATPSFGSFSRQGTLYQGSTTFKVGSQQYLIAANLDPACGRSSALYALNGVNDLQFLQCVEADGTRLTVSGGEVYSSPSAGTFLFLGAGLFGDAYLFEAIGSGTGLRLSFLQMPAGMKGRRDEISIDANYRLLASADFKANEVRFWDLTNPGNPVRKTGTGWTLAGTSAGYVEMVSASSSSPLVLWTGTAGWKNSTRTYLVDPATGPDEFASAYWRDLTEPFNEFQQCTFDMDAALSRDGSALYLSRYVTHQVFDLTGCLGPTQAVADITATPSTVFPGQAVTLRDASIGTYDRWALWVERNGAFETGYQTLSDTNPQQLAYTVPKNVDATSSFAGRLRIASTELTPLKEEDTAAITVNRTPQATITVIPEAAIVGDTVTLSASAEGVPASVDPFTWVISRPSTATSFPKGQTVQVTLDQAGDWTFRLTVNYEHAASGEVDPDADGLYEDVVTQVFTVSSVAADFTVSPPTPLNNQALTLDGSISKGAVASYQWTVSGPTDRGADGISPSNYGGCPAASVCTIPADTLEWGSYAVTLRVSDGNGEADEQLKNVTVANGAIQPVFSWIPSDPEIGDSVVFTINGVMGDIDRATWTMGGTGCDGAPATQVCTPSQFNNCKAQSFKYASGGSKVVGLTVRVNGVDYVDARPPAERTVTVASTGSCSDDGGGTTCDYHLSSDGATFGPAGGSGAFTVFTDSGCSWSARESLDWLTITAGTSGVGTGTVRYTVAANSGPLRSGSIIAAGEVHRVQQEAPFVPANFVMSNPRPEIGETVSFSVDPILQVDSWNFGEADCRGNNPVINCAFLPPGACNEMTWSWASEGDKSVTMVLADGRRQTKVPTVRPVGECCLADRAPLASFTASNEEPEVGQEIVFTDTSAKLLATKALGFSWTPANPAIGEMTTFTLSGVAGEIASATWNFGGTGCGGASATVTCTPGLFNPCLSQTFKYATAGDKQVSVTLQLVGGGSAGAGPVTLTVASVGSCDGGGGGGCSYALSPLSANFPPAGGEGSFSVTTSAGCAWDATTSSSWIVLDEAAGSGPGTVTYTVGPHAGVSDRSGFVNVEGRTHTVRQAAPAIEVESDPTWWDWTVEQLLEEGGSKEVAKGHEQVFRYAFEEPGTFRVTLEAGNCVGSSRESLTVSVVDSPVEDFVVGAAVSIDGANDTHWESDLRFYNPCGEPLDVRIEYEPEGTDNTGGGLVFREFALAPDETRLFADLTEAIPGLVGEALSGSVRIASASASGCKVLSVSRTFNQTQDGSLGLFVPAVPVKRAEHEFLDLTGLISDGFYRTNLRLVNYGDEGAWVDIFAYDTFGNPVSDTRSAWVEPHSTRQINEVAEWLGIGGDLGPFSVRAEVTELQVEAFATVVDNTTGDSVLFMSSFTGANRIWVVGVASTSGVNDSRWRTDLWLYNPTEEWLAGEVDFVVGTTPSDVYGFEFPDLKAHRVRDYLDIVGHEFNLSETSGYLIVAGADGGPAPQVAARTYNLGLEGGTYGLNVRAFTEDDLLEPGEAGFIVGVSNSADQSVGFRTNLGLLNTDQERWTGVILTLYDVTGAVIGEPLEMLIAPGALRQFDLAERFGVSGVTGSASLKIEVTEGGGVAAYATEIDNRTQDSIFIPAQRPFKGAAR